MFLSLLSSCFQREVSGYGPKRQEVHYLKIKTGVTVRIQLSVLAAYGLSPGRGLRLGCSSLLGVVLKSHCHGLQHLVCLTQDRLSVESGAGRRPPREVPQRPGEGLGSLGAFPLAFGATQICCIECEGRCKCTSSQGDSGRGQRVPAPTLSGRARAVGRLS